MNNKVKNLLMQAPLGVADLASVESFCLLVQVTFDVDCSEGKEELFH